jgi:hypothetical protein
MVLIPELDYYSPLMLITKVGKVSVGEFDLPKLQLPYKTAPERPIPLISDSHSGVESPDSANPETQANAPVLGERKARKVVRTMTGTLV